MAELLELAAGRSAQVLNITSLANRLQVDRRTVESYLRLLEDLFLVFRLPAWGKTLNSRATGTPKVHMVDSGLAASPSTAKATISREAQTNGGRRQLYKFCPT